MQIFVSDEDPWPCAMALDNKRVVKMILESAQFLSCALYINGAPAHSLPCGIGWYHHPLAKWAAHSRSNYLWLWDHFQALCFEYMYRFNKVHSYHNFLPFFIKNLQWTGKCIERTPFYNATVFKTGEGNIHARYKMYLAWKWTSQDKRPPTWTNRDRKSVV